MDNSIEFEDKITERQRKTGEILVLVFGLVFIILSSYFSLKVIFGKFSLIIAGVASVIFLFLFKKNGLGTKNSSNFQIKSGGIFSMEKKKLISWKDISKIEITKRSRRILPMMWIFQGQDVTGIPMNMINKDILNLEKMIKSYGINVEIKGFRLNLLE
jgi:hypothetical protein